MTASLEVVSLIVQNLLIAVVVVLALYIGNCWGKGARPRGWRRR